MSWVAGKLRLSLTSRAETYIIRKSMLRIRRALPFWIHSLMARVGISYFHSVEFDILEHRQTDKVVWLAENLINIQHLSQIAMPTTS